MIAIDNADSLHVRYSWPISSQIPVFTQPGLISDKTLKEKLSGCSDMTIWRLRRNGKLPKPKKLGNRNVTPEDEADKAIAELVRLS